MSTPMFTAMLCDYRSQSAINAHRADVAQQSGSRFLYKDGRNTVLSTAGRKGFTNETTSRNTTIAGVVRELGFSAYALCCMTCGSEAERLALIEYSFRGARTKPT